MKEALKNNGYKMISFSYGHGGDTSKYINDDGVIATLYENGEFDFSYPTSIKDIFIRTNRILKMIYYDNKDREIKLKTKQVLDMANKII